MPSFAEGVNPDLLSWARERSGLSVTEAAARIKRSADVLRAWERGDGVPTFRQLEYLAETLYKRPIALFFFPNPPEEEEAKGRFRTLPQGEVEAFAPDTLLALREGLAFQQSLSELTDGRNPAANPIHKAVTAHTRLSVSALASQVRTYLQVPLDVQREWGGAETAFKAWRSALEAVGVFVLKRSFKQKSICGFCLYDDAFPVIVINNGQAHSRQIFTAFHELAHLLFRVSSITKTEDEYLGSMTAHGRRLEEYCNEFAAEFLIPDASFPYDEFDARQLDQWVSRIAAAYSVSREAILRRLLDAHLVDDATYARKAAEWTAEYLRRRKRSSGGNYYATKAAYLGESFIGLAFRQFHRGTLDLPQLAAHLRVKARSVSGLEDYVSAGN